MKKVRVTLPEDIWRILKNDIDDFGINNNRLCNYILDQYKFGKESSEKELEKAQGKPLKKILQFDLNKENRDIYYDILQENHVQVEAEFFRDLFVFYTSKFKYQRELFVFQTRVRRVYQAIQDDKKIKIRYENKLKKVNPYFVKRNEQGDENYLFCYDDDEDKYKTFLIKELEVIGIVDEKIEIKNKKYIDKFRKNFDPFMANGHIVKVALTEDGERLFKNITDFRPKLVSKNKNIYTFESSNENARLYFRQFSKEAEIIEPQELREIMAEEFRVALKKYLK